MDVRQAQVVLQPIILGDLVIEEDEENPGLSSQFLETFRRNQTQNPSEGGLHEGALVLIRTNGLPNRRNYILPAIIPHLDRPFRAVIPLPHLPELGLGSGSRPEVILEESEADMMNPLSGIWTCACPVPGSQPLISCSDCRRRECFEWTWNQEGNDSTAVFQNDNRDVIFNPGFSVGTVAVKGSKPLKQGCHHYWEIEMCSDVYGTDMMIGVGTEKTDLRKHSHSFVSLIGLDEQSWGLSYTGTTQHNGKTQHYTKNFGQHTVVGVHLDMWSGSLEFYINRKPIGKAFTGLKGKVLYPMISSTAARSGMNLIFSRSYAHSLQLQTLLSIGKSMFLPDNISLFKVLPQDIIPPGLKLWMKNNFWWITSNKEKNSKAVEKTESKKKILETPGTSQSQGPRRIRKPKKEEIFLRSTESEGGILTRSMAARRGLGHLPGTNPIFAPPETTSRTVKSPRVRRPVPRSSSSPCVRDAHHLDDEDCSPNQEEPPRASSSASHNEPGSKRMCLRSWKKK